MQSSSLSTLFCFADLVLQHLWSFTPSKVRIFFHIWKYHIYNDHLSLPEKKKENSFYKISEAHLALPCFATFQYQRHQLHVHEAVLTLYWPKNFDKSFLKFLLKNVSKRSCTSLGEFGCCNLQNQKVQDIFFCTAKKIVSVEI